MKSLLVYGLIVLTLSACGWHLRGSGDMKPDIQSVYVATDDQYSEFAQQLIRSIEAYNIEISDSPETAEYQLVVGREKRGRRTISVANDALASEYELSYSVSYRLDRDGITVLPTSRAEVSRSYEFDRNAIVAKSEEQELIYREMQASVIQQILRRLRFAAQSEPSGNSQP